MLLVQGILLALLARHRTGVGQRVTTSLLDSMIYMQQQEATALLNANQVVNWIALPRNGTFQTKDGKWIVMIGAFKADPLGDICRALDLEPLGGDPRFATEEAQQAHRAELQAIFKRRFAELTQEEALARLEREDVLCAPVHSLKEALDDLQVLLNEMVIDVPHSRLGSFRTVGIPVKLSETPGEVRRHPPDPGEHTRELLAEVGYSEKEIDRFVRDGVV
jgi:formyl-CoA transferase